MLGLILALIAAVKTSSATNYAARDIYAYFSRN